MKVEALTRLFIATDGRGQRLIEAGTVFELKEGAKVTKWMKPLEPVVKAAEAPAAKLAPAEAAAPAPAPVATTAPAKRGRPVQNSDVL